LDRPSEARERQSYQWQDVLRKVFDEPLRRQPDRSNLASNVSITEDDEAAVVVEFLLQQKKTKRTKGDRVFVSFVVFCGFSGSFRVALHWTSNRPGSQRVIWCEDRALFHIASSSQRAADGDRPRSALKHPHLAQLTRSGIGACDCA